MQGEVFEAAIDNADRDNFKIVRLASPLDMPHITMEVELKGIHIAKRGLASVRVDLSVL